MPHHCHAIGFKCFFFPILLCLILQVKFSVIYSIHDETTMNSDFFLSFVFRFAIVTAEGIKIQTILNNNEKNRWTLYCHHCIVLCTNVNTKMNTLTVHPHFLAMLCPLIFVRSGNSWNLWRIFLIIMIGTRIERTKSGKE